MRTVIIIVAAVLSSGCYEYLPAPSSGNGGLYGRRINLTLTDMGSAALAQQIGPQNDAIRGALLADTANALLVSVNSVRNRNGIEQDWRGERLTVPVQFVDRVEQRSFSKRKTVLASIATGAALFFVHQAFTGAGGSNHPGHGPGGGTLPR
jgi:hypothetical protein